MPADTSNTNEWPDELDALVSAPGHHKLLMENDFVRVINTLIPPGEVTNIHTHKWPASLYIISWSNFIRYDAEGTVIVDSRKLSQTPLPSSAIWSEALKPHALENIGENDIHIISVEIKS
jgi:quercetin dioxygenase-like cupin family protein